MSRELGRRHSSQDYSQHLSGMPASRRPLNPLHHSTNLCNAGELVTEDMASHSPAKLTLCLLGVLIHPFLHLRCPARPSIMLSHPSCAVGEDGSNTNLMPNASCPPLRGCPVHVCGGSAEGVEGSVGSRGFTPGQVFACRSTVEI